MNKIELKRGMAVVSAVFASLTLAACQNMPRTAAVGGQQPQAQAPAVAAQQAPQVAPQAQAAAQGQPVSFFLAQPRQVKGMVRVPMEKGELWMVPQPVMSHADLESVEPRRSKAGQPFVRFTFTPAGRSKLQQITAGFRGRVLVTTVGRNVVSMQTMDTTISNGVLDVLARSDQEAIAIANAVARPVRPG